MAKIILSCASEADVIAKKLCSILDEDKKARSIGGYKEVLLDKIKDFPDTKIAMA